MYLYLPNLWSILRQTFSPRRFNLRHASLGVLFLTLFFLLRAAVWLARLLDRLLYPEYRRQKLDNPLFIIGNPRSGTTFTHRLLALDDRFVTFELWQTILPAVCLHRLVGVLARLDTKLGSPLGRLLNTASAKGFQGWEAIHRTGPRAVESDEMLFMYGLLSPLLTLQFPFFQALRPAIHPDELPDAQRRKLMRYYRDSLQRHVYAAGPDRVLLEKVALIAGRLESVLETLPDARIIHLVRHPYESIPSLMSMFTKPWKGLAPQMLEDPEALAGLAEMIFEYYRAVARARASLPPERFLEIRYEELKADPKAALERAYAHFGMEVGDRFGRILQSETNRARSYKSGHSYSLEEFGLSREKVYAALRPEFEAYGFQP